MAKEHIQNDERIEELRRVALGLVDTFLHLQVAVSGVRIEIDAIKSLLIPEGPQKQQFAQRIAAAANNLPPALQQLHVKLQRYRADLEALALKSKPLN